MSKLKPNKDAFCCFCNLVFCLKEREEAKLTRAGWAHMACVEKVFRKQEHAKRDVPAEFVG